MTVISVVLGVLLLLIALWDTFETIVLPRTVTRRVRLTRIFYLTFWGLWSKIARRTCQNAQRESMLSAFGPLSLLLLLAVWAVCLILSFAMIQWGLRIPLHGTAANAGFGEYLFTSSLTLLTMGFGAISPVTPQARTMAVAEAGVGLGFLALVIGYFPVLYQSFSRREVGISLLDARAGSPPTGAELLRRYGATSQMRRLTAVLAEWERWSADVLESHLSYPVLAFYRSQHDRESWLAALTAILDACSLILIGFEVEEPWQADLVWQAHLTFAIGRHAVIDMALVTRLTPHSPTTDRLEDDAFITLCLRLDDANIRLQRDAAARAKLAGLRSQYEPHVNVLADRLLLSLPPWIHEEEVRDNWQTSAWDNDHFH